MHDLSVNKENGGETLIIFVLSFMCACCSFGGLIVWGGANVSVLH